jgi:subtilisin family serine protease
LVKIPDNSTLKDALDSLQENAFVEYAEPNFVWRIDSELIPNDPRFHELWGLRNTGQSGGTPDADIDAPEAWTLEIGKRDGVIAVVDTGIDYTHPDLIDNMWHNPNEIPGNGIDDDHNGYIDDVYGIDTYNQDSDPFDDNGHGTHCAGTIGAVGNNGIGVTGVNWMTKIMALKFMGSGGYGFTDDVIECMEYSIAMKERGIDVRVLSNSWGGNENSQALHDAISAAGSHGILFVAAAGNSAQNNDLSPSYPASYPNDNVISVAATNRKDDLASFSNWGGSTVDVGAPGESILSTTPGNTYTSYSGTSMATPHVSGLAALIMAMHPSYSYLQVKTSILSTVDKPSSLHGKVLSNGRINAWRALTANDTTMLITVMEPTYNFRLIKGAAYNLSAWVHTEINPILGASVQTAFSGGEPSVTLRDDGIFPDEVANDGIYTNGWTSGVQGNRTITVSSTAIGFDSASTSVTGYIESVPTYQISDTAYRWIELAGYNVGDCMGYNSYQVITTPFNIYFYGRSYSNLTVSPDGVLYFENRLIGWENMPIPSSNEYGVEGLVAVLWDELNMKPEIDRGVVFMGITGTQHDRILVIEWKDVARFYSTGRASFEGLFFENKTDIIFQYRDVSFESPDYDFGANATVGIQYNRHWGTQFSYNSPSLRNEYAIRLSLNTSLRDIASVILGAPQNTIHYIRTGNVFDDSSLGFVYGRSDAIQDIVSVSDPSYVDQATGEPAFTGNLVAFGGRYADKVTKYYEDHGLAAIGYQENATHIVFRHTVTGRTICSIPKSTFDSNVKDYFVIQGLNQGSRKVLLLWGVSALGTYASGMCFADIITPHIADYGDLYYIYSWEDLNGDHMQSSEEISLITSGS